MITISAVGQKNIGKSIAKLECKNFAVCLLTPIISASCAMIGMVAEAWPVADGMKKLIRVCTTRTLPVQKLCMRRIFSAHLTSRR